jgi:hypothetical protein
VSGVGSIPCLVSVDMIRNISLALSRDVLQNALFMARHAKYAHLSRYSWTRYMLRVFWVRC